MKDPEAGWFEIKHAQNREAHLVAIVVQHIWHAQYLWPTIVVFYTEI
jgi:hypothetical protein